MHKEQITDKEAFCLIIVYIIGSTLIIGIASDAKNDAWISGLLAMAMALPVLLLYSRIISLFPGMDLYEILGHVLGRVAGTAVSILYIWYSIHLGALVIRNFGEFINAVALPETPILVPMLCIGLVGVCAVRAGIEAMGRLCSFFLPVLLFIIIAVQILAIPEIELHFLRPVLGGGAAPVLQGGFSTFAFPFAETVLFMGVFYSLKTKGSPYKVYLWGLLLSGLIIVTITIRNVTVLGEMADSFFFPSYVAVGRISVGDFIERIEVTVSIVFVFCALAKSSVCLLVTCKGLSRLFGLSDYRPIVIQTGLIMVYFSYFVYDSIMQMQYWAFKVYTYYAFPFEVILPVIIWISAEIKAKKMGAPKSTHDSSSDDKSTHCKSSH